MSLFKCVQCGCVENTAACGLVFEREDTGEIVSIEEAGQDFGPKKRRKLICSECNPEIGKWHGLFPKQDADEAGYVPIPGSRYIERVGR